MLSHSYDPGIITLKDILFYQLKLPCYDKQSTNHNGFYLNQYSDPQGTFLLEEVVQGFKERYKERNMGNHRSIRTNYSSNS